MERWYQLKADLVGSYIIPGALFIYHDETGEKKEIKTSQIFIEVKSVIEDKDAAKDIRDIKPLAVLTKDYTLILSLSLVGLALLGLSIGGFYWYRVTHRKTQVPPPRPAHELALEELAHLRKEGLIEKGIYKEHYFKLSEIFRRYLERRFRFPAVERTTEEILPQIYAIPGCDEQVKRSAQSFLSQTDLVKFAKHIPTTQEVEREYQEAVAFITHTKEDLVQTSQSV